MEPAIGFLDEEDRCSKRDLTWLDKPLVEVLLDVFFGCEELFGTLLVEWAEAERIVCFQLNLVVVGTMQRKSVRGSFRKNILELCVFFG